MVCGSMNCGCADHRSQFLAPARSIIIWRQKPKLVQCNKLITSKTGTAFIQFQESGMPSACEWSTLLNKPKVVLMAGGKLE